MEWYRCVKCGEFIYGNRNYCPKCKHTVFDRPAIVPWKEKLKTHWLKWLSVFILLILMWKFEGCKYFHLVLD